MNILEVDSSANRFKRVRRMKPESDLYRIEMPELRIVSQELWERVKARQKIGFERGRKIREALGERARTGRGPGFLFSGLLRCGCCGSNYVMSNRDSYGCIGRKKGICTNNRLVKRSVVEQRLLDALRYNLFTLEHIRGFQEKAKRIATERKRDQ